jgi:hypothetical protein
MTCAPIPDPFITGLMWGLTIGFVIAGCAAIALYRFWPMPGGRI